MSGDESNEKCYAPAQCQPLQGNRLLKCHTQSARAGQGENTERKEHSPASGGQDDEQGHEKGVTLQTGKEGEFEQERTDTTKNPETAYPAVTHDFQAALGGPSTEEAIAGVHQAI